MKLSSILKVSLIWLLVAASAQSKNSEFDLPFSSGPWSLVKAGYEPFVGLKHRRIKSPQGFSGEFVSDLGFYFRNHMIVGFEAGEWADGWEFPAEVKQEGFNYEGIYLGFSVTPNTFMRTRVEYLRGRGNLYGAERDISGNRIEGTKSVGTLNEIRAVVDLRLSPWARVNLMAGQRQFEFKGSELESLNTPVDAFDGVFVSGGLALGFFL